MKKRKRIWWVVLILAVLAMGGAFVHFYPAWRAAKILQEKMDFTHFSYEMEMELDKGQLSAGQVKMFRILGELLGVEEDGMYSFTVKGRVRGERIYALLYLKGAKEPLAEFYVGEEGIALNEAMVYNTIRNGLVEQYGALGRLMPEQKGNLYISLEQVEQMFGVELREICQFAFPAMDGRLTAGQYFAMLAVMERERIGEGNRFEIAKKRMKARLDISVAEESEVRMRLEMQDPAKTLSQATPLLSRMGVRLPVERLRMLKNFSMTIAAGEGAEITMPTDYVEQGTINLIAEIRALIERLLNRKSDSGSGIIYTHKRK